MQETAPCREPSPLKNFDEEIDNWIEREAARRNLGVEELVIDLIRKGTKGIKAVPVPTKDMWIATVALQHRLPVFTYDSRFSHI